MLFDNVAAPVVYSVKGQVEAVVPYEVSHRRSTQVAIEYEGKRSRPVSLPIVDSAPALFTLDSSGKGQAAMLNETGCCNSVRNPATRGTIASLYATGEGRPRQPPPFVFPVKVTVGGVPAEILYANNVGELVVNFRVPLNAPTGGAVPLVLTVGESRSTDGVTMAVRSSNRGILIVDSAASIRNQAAEILKRAGYEVFTAAGLREAGVQAANHPIDLLITALAAPALIHALIQTIRNQHPQLKIITMSEDDGPGALRGRRTSWEPRPSSRNL